MSRSLQTDPSSVTDEGQELIGRQTCRPRFPPRKYQFRGIKSKGAILVLVWVFLFCGCFITLFWISADSTRATSILKNKAALAAVIIITLSCPFAGWLADVYFGRYKVIQVGLWLMWVGTMLGLLTLGTQYTYTVCHYKAGQVVLDVGIPLAAILCSIGFACFMVNSVQFGTDQMPDASGEQVSAFIHWYMWAVFAGYGVARVTYLLNTCAKIDMTCYKVQTYQLFVPCALSSLALCSNFLFRDCLIIEPQSQNPLKSVVRVLKFASTHKRPIRQSAFNYCGEERPSRIDLGKSKYGGPFTTEEVEDVKTCLRMQVVILSTLAFFIPGQLYLISRSYLKLHFRQSFTDSHSLCFLSALYSEATFAVVSIPLYEFIVYPLFRNRIPGISRRLVFGSFMNIVLNAVILSTDTAGHFLSDKHVCMFSKSTSSSETLPIEFMWVGLPSNFLVTLQLSFFLISIFEFACAQAPYNMRGLLIGMIYSLLCATFPASYGILVAWVKAWEKYPHSSKLSCDFWFFVFQLLMAVIGLFSLMGVTKWYKRRQREEPNRDRQFVEDFYYRYCVERHDARSP